MTYGCDNLMSDSERDAIAAAAHIDVTTRRAGLVRAMLAERYGAAVPVTDDMVRAVLHGLDQQEASDG